VAVGGKSLDEAQDAVFRHLKRVLREPQVSLTLAQAAGRCNREGRLAGLGVVNVFVAPTQPPHAREPGLVGRLAALCRGLVSLHQCYPRDWRFCMPCKRRRPYGAC
jgi:hypothetical protein